MNRVADWRWITLVMLSFALSLVPSCGGGGGGAGPMVTLVSISLTPTNPSIPVGNTQQFAATGTFSDGTSHDITTQVTWSSSNTSLATITSSGLATSVATGTTTITAASGSMSGGTTLTVTAPTGGGSSPGTGPDPYFPSTTDHVKKNYGPTGCISSYLGTDIENRGEPGNVFVSAVWEETKSSYSEVFYMDHDEKVIVWLKVSCWGPSTVKWTTRPALSGDTSDGHIFVERQ